jgi:neutral trehalase
LLSLAQVYLLFFKIKAKEQAEYVHQRLCEHFIKTGCLQTTLERTGQQ